MSEQKKYGVPEVLAALEAAVTERGAGYVYEQPRNVRGDHMGCLYVHARDTESETPGCIAGQVYYDLTGEMVPGDMEVAIFDGNALTDEWLTRAPFTPDALRILAVAQDRQDDSHTWGSALAAAKQKAAEV